MDEKKTKFIGGPGDGIPVSGGGKENIALPLDKNLNQPKTKDETYAYAFYRLTPTGDYEFYGAQRKEAEKPFDIEFVDGPMKGIHPFMQAIQLYDNTFRVPLDAEHRPLGQGAIVAAEAEYKRKQIDGVWKMAVVGIVDNPKEVEEVADALAESQLVRELQVYTTEQLVKELLNRQGFAGVIVMLPGDMVGKWHLKKGSPLFIGMERQMNAEQAKVILRSAFKSLEEE